MRGLGILLATDRMGRHQPPTNRSFYLSVAASTLRFAIIVALAVGGIVVINQAFDEPSAGGPGPIGATGTTAPPTTGPTGATGATETGPTGPTADPEGVVIAVFNGTSVTGLAGDTMARLVDRFGYVEGQDVADAPSEVPVTTIYYARARDRVEAEYLANEDKLFRRLDDVRIARLPDSEEVDSSVQLAIYLGNDYAQLVA